MTKADLVDEMARRSGMTKKDSELALNTFMDVVKDTLVKGKAVTLIGFGSFEVRARKERQGRNPKKPDEMVTIPASKAPVFKAGKPLKDAVNGK